MNGHKQRRARGLAWILSSLVVLSGCTIFGGSNPNNPSERAPSGVLSPWTGSAQSKSTTGATKVSAPGKNQTQGMGMKDRLDIPDLVEANAPAVVTVAVRKGSGGGIFGLGQYEEGVGSGFFIDARGLVATNNHVVAGASKVNIILSDGTQAPGKVLWTDPANDLAIVQAQNLQVPGVVTIGNSDTIRVGEGVVAIGNPMSADFAGTVTSGIVSAKNRKIRTREGTFEYLQIDAAINGGNSGGPLFNLKGEVIGINSAKIAQSGIEGMAFSIPINVLMEKIGKNPTTKDQANEPVSLGVVVQDIPLELRERYNAPEGIMIMEVKGGSAAEAAGVRKGDILTQFGGEKVTSIVQLNTLKSKYKPGDSVTFVIFRDAEGKFYQGTMVLKQANSR
ncbi:HtrA protease/chaperone protein [Clostridiaceae bacterium JG1575]|nr:HtrA protease/chaperone protein [Clostridiaceae bacterium JG1575]